MRPDVRRGARAEVALAALEAHVLVSAKLIEVVSHGTGRGALLAVLLMLVGLHTVVLEATVAPTRTRRVRALEVGLLIIGHGARPWGEGRRRRRHGLRRDSAYGRRRGDLAQGAHVESLLRRHNVRADTPFLRSNLSFGLALGCRERRVFRGYGGDGRGCPTAAADRGRTTSAGASIRVSDAPVLSVGRLGTTSPEPVRGLRQLALAGLAVERATVRIGRQSRLQLCERQKLPAKKS